MIYLLAFPALGLFWAFCVVAFNRPRANYVGGNRVFIEAARIFTLLTLDTNAAMREIGEAAKRSLPHMKRLADELKKIPPEIWDADREWAEMEQ